MLQIFHQVYKTVKLDYARGNTEELLLQCAPGSGSAALGTFEVRTSVLAVNLHV